MEGRFLLGLAQLMVSTDDNSHSGDNFPLGLAEPWQMRYGKGFLGVRERKRNNGHAKRGGVYLEGCCDIKQADTPPALPPPLPPTTKVRYKKCSSLSSYLRAGTGRAKLLIFQIFPFFVLFFDVRMYQSELSILNFNYINSDNDNNNDNNDVTKI